MDVVGPIGGSSGDVLPVRGTRIGYTLGGPQPPVVLDGTYNKITQEIQLDNHVHFPLIPVFFSGYVFHSGADVLYLCGTAQTAFSNITGGPTQRWHATLSAGGF